MSKPLAILLKPQMPEEELANLISDNVWSTVYDRIALDIEGRVPWEPLIHYFDSTIIEIDPAYLSRG